MQPDADLPLLAWAASHEETPERFVRSPDDPRDFTAEWAAFVEAKPDVAARILGDACERMRLGSQRVSIDAIFETQRAIFKVSLDNNHRAACARWAIAQRPALAGVIRTRATTRTK